MVWLGHPPRGGERRGKEGNEKEGKGGGKEGVCGQGMGGKRWLHLGWNLAAVSDWDSVCGVLVCESGCILYDYALKKRENNQQFICGEGRHTICFMQKKIAKVKAKQKPSRFHIKIREGDMFLFSAQKKPER